MKTIIHYFQTRALKQIAQWLVVATFSIIILGVFAIADAYAAGSLTPPPSFSGSTTLNLLNSYQCADLRGTAGGSCNIDQGCLNFDNEPPSENLAAEICGPNTVVTNGNLQDFELHGWVWDTNLGYVSLYCDTNGQNNGVDCGSIPYGVKVDVQHGDMSGWAWSDNIGWISFGCENGLNEGYACGSIDYSVQMDMRIGKDLGVMSGYAWADSVGWFDFQHSNSRANILDLMMRTSSTETDWGVWTKGEIGGNLSADEKNGPPLKSNMPVAGSGNGYDLFVYVADIAGNPILNSAEATVDIETQWKDTVGSNQTDDMANDSSDRNGGIVVKPSVKNNAGEVLSVKGPATTGGIVGAYYGLVTSTMPTDGGNCYDGDGDGSCYTGDDNFFYKDFVEGGNGPANDLIYNSATVTVNIPSTGETWTRIVKPLGYTSGRRMDFLPQVDIPKLDYLMTPGDDSSGVPVIQALRNKLDEFKIRVKQNASSGTWPVHLVLDSGVPDANYVFVNSSDMEADPNTLSSTKVLTDTGSEDSIFALPYAPSEDALQEFLPGAYLHSVVTIDHGFTAAPSSYFSNGLPRVFNSEIQTQVAEIISGNVFSPGAKEVVQGSNVPLFGDVAVYALRTQILKDVSSLIKGLSSSTSTSPVTINSSAILSGNSFKDGKLYYFNNQDVTIDDISALANKAPGKPITVVVKGGDLYINDNIDTGQAFGFIVFESDDDTNQATKGGRIYVNSDVTDMVNVHIFSDGPIFRYTNGVCYYWGNYGPSNSLVGLREPGFVETGRCSDSGSFKEPTVALPNQFYLKGNLASFNCLGCSTNIKPSRGDGLDLGGANARNFAIARLYDFNYFSYYRKNPVTNVFSGKASTNVATNPKITNKDKAVYFEYLPAPTDLLGFRNF